MLSPTTTMLGPVPFTTVQTSTGWPDSRGTRAARSPRPVATRESSSFGPGSDVLSARARALLQAGLAVEDRRRDQTPIRMLVVNPITITGVRSGRARGDVRMGCSMRWKLSAASTVAVGVAIAQELATG